jgi:hypothetical protein
VCPGCEDLPYVGDKKVKRFHFSEIIGRLPYVRATVTRAQVDIDLYGCP